MIKKIILGFSLCAGFSALAQQGTSSPYSYYGIGDVKFKGTHEIRTMGSLAVYQDSLHLNTLNPASYSNLQSTTFSLGFSNTSNQIKSANASASANRTSFDYFALAFPAGKFGFSFGIMPYSFVGYSIANTAKEGDFTVDRKFNGEGGINRAFLGMSYKITKKLSIGAEAAYNFGDTENTAIKFITDDGSSFPVNRGSRELIANDYSGMTFNFGANYTQPLTEEVKLTLGATFSPETKLANNQVVKLATVYYNNDNLVVDQEQETSNTSHDLLFATKYSFGATVGNPMQWMIGAEYTGTNNEKMNAYFKNPNTSYTNAHKFAVGGFYTPDYRPYFSNFFERITYRAGAKYEKTGFVMNGKEINDISASIGFGVPIGLRNRNVSNLNIGLEYGQRGTTKNTLIKENYFNVSVGLSFNDFWFIKRKYD